MSKVSMILECIHERLMDIEVLVDMKRVKLEQCVNLLQFESEANQVCVQCSLVSVLYCWNLLIQTHEDLVSDSMELHIEF